MLQKNKGMSGIIPERDREQGTIQGKSNSSNNRQVSLLDKDSKVNHDINTTI